MKTEQEIKDRIIFLNGYIEGQKESYAACEDNIKCIEYKIKALMWVLAEESDK